MSKFRSFCVDIIRPPGIAEQSVGALPVQYSASGFSQVAIVLGVGLWGSGLQKTHETPRLLHERIVECTSRALEIQIVRTTSGMTPLQRA